jgi:TPP-dependent indolepyruvate ferredoxin oxidoreductase alpha subunit
MANIFVDRTTTWHAIGKDVSECKNMEQVLRGVGVRTVETVNPLCLEEAVETVRRAIIAYAEMLK